MSLLVSVALVVLKQALKCGSPNVVVEISLWFGDGSLKPYMQFLCWFKYVQYGSLMVFV